MGQHAARYTDTELLKRLTNGRDDCRSEYQLQLVEGDQMLFYESQFGPDSAS
jgi:hypothetical protein